MKYAYHCIQKIQTPTHFQVNLEEVPVNCSNHEAHEMSELIIPLPEARTHFKQAKRSGVKQVF